MKKIFLPLIYLLFCGSIYSQINNGLFAHFPFDNNFNDVSGSSIIASNSGASFGADRNGVVNNAIACNGTGYVSIPNNDLKIQFPISIAYWVKFNSLSQIQFPFATDNVFNNYHGVWMNNLPNGAMTLSFGGGNGGSNTANQRYFSTSTTPLSAGVWHHVVGVIRDYNDMDIYVDCVKTTGSYGGTGSTSVVYSTSGPSRIGAIIGNASAGGDFILNGSIDQFAVWNRSLTQNDVTFLCDNNNTLSIEKKSNSDVKEVVKIIDFMGRETKFKPNTPLIYIYSDGSTQRIMEMK